MEINMFSQLILLICALGGASIGAISSLITVWISKKYEDKKEFRKVLLEAAITDWKESIKLGIKKVDSGKNVTIFPLDSYLLLHSKIFEIISNGKLNEEKLKETFKECNKFHELYLENNKKLEEKNKNFKNSRS